jgi:hypothetical protein
MPGGAVKNECVQNIGWCFSRLCGRGFCRLIGISFEREIIMKPNRNSFQSMLVVGACAATGIALAAGCASADVVTGLTGAAFSFDAGSSGFSGTGALGETFVPLNNGNGTPYNETFALGGGISLNISAPSGGFNGTSGPTAASGTLWENYAFGTGTPTLTFEGLTAGDTYEIAGYALTSDAFTVGSSTSTVPGVSSGSYTYVLGTTYTTLTGTADSSGDLAVGLAPGTTHTNFRVAGIGIASVTTPEPASLGLLAVGALGFLLLRKRNRRAV